MKWSPQQDQALHSVREWLVNPRGKKIFRLFGYAGTGKTTLAIEIAKMVQGRCLFSSFTGKAALVMRRKGCEGARTIHSLIYKIREDDDDDANDGDVKFQLNLESELAGAALLIVDECSMVDEELGQDLMSFKTPILVLGDPAQLPPVAGGGYFTNHKPDVMLSEIHRQADGNPILHIATEIRLGNRIDFGNLKGDSAGQGVSIMRRSEIKRNSMLAADQILCGRNDTRAGLNRKMRAHLRDVGRLGYDEDFYTYPDQDGAPVVGDKIICLKNKRDRALFNGGIWKVRELLTGKRSKKDGEVKKKGRTDVNYLAVDSMDDTEIEDIPVYVPKYFWFWNGKAHDLNLPDNLTRRNFDEFDYAYAITCHKSQGSQWDKVVVMDESSVFSRGDDGADMARRWLYTAVTRAAEALIIAR